jgi:hypothetical protein
VAVGRASEEERILVALQEARRSKNDAMLRGDSFSFEMVNLYGAKFDLVRLLTRLGSTSDCSTIGLWTIQPNS